MTTSPELPTPGLADAPAAPRGRRRAGLVLMWTAAAVGVAAVLLTATSERVVLVLADLTVTAPVLITTTGGAFVVAAAGHLLSRRPGPLRTGERYLLVALVGPVVLMVILLVIPLLGFFFLLLLEVAAQAFVAPGPVLVTLAVIIGCATVIARAGRPAQAPAGTDPHEAAEVSTPRPMIRGIAAAVLLMTIAGAVVTGAGWAVIRLGDDLATARDPGGCAAVVRQTQAMFTGTAVLYVARPGSLLAHRHEEYPLEESFPFRTGSYTLTAGPDTVHVAFDDGRGNVDSRIPCA
ncbi:hypothetical protein [Cellulomonas bogoriensis]|uniref:Uncharacterized protein n=1 Tax=Cellulomonas bogoriensis 69B4 = DSM 16987 TaxID=1386082 RepID=A0A0A0BWB4_9CELL|nr:hypothetical protein [Cellulomonas bogoriensis]KGM11469.1 hypothetical protein N869_03060 [Cellulomonas bogoriensis 69B4 = DSM 16987]